MERQAYQARVAKLLRTAPIALPTAVTDAIRRESYEFCDADGQIQRERERTSFVAGAEYVLSPWAADEGVMRSVLRDAFTPAAAGRESAAWEGELTLDDIPAGWAADIEKAALGAIVSSEQAAKEIEYRAFVGGAELSLNALQIANIPPSAYAVPDGALTVANALDAIPATVSSISRTQTASIAHVQRSNGSSASIGF